MKLYIGYIVRGAFCLAVLAVWQRVRMGIPLDVVMHHPQIIWSSATEAAKWVK